MAATDIADKIIALQNEKTFIPLEAINGNFFGNEVTKYPTLRLCGSSSAFPKGFSDHETIVQKFNTRLSGIYTILKSNDILIVGGSVIYAIKNPLTNIPSDIGIDCLVLSNNREGFKKAVIDIKNYLQCNRAYKWHSIIRTKKGIIINCLSIETSTPLKIQFLNILWKDANDILRAFDIGSCQGMFRPSTGEVTITAPTYYALKYDANILNVDFASDAFESRIERYLLRGFGLVCVGLERDLGIRQFTYNGQPVKREDGRYHFGKMSFEVSKYDDAANTFFIKDVEISGKRVSSYAVEDSDLTPIGALNAIIDGPIPLYHTITDSKKINTFEDIFAENPINEELLREGYEKLKIFTGDFLNLGVIRRFFPDFCVESLSISDFTRKGNYHLLVERQIVCHMRRLPKNCAEDFFVEFGASDKLLVRSRGLTLSEWYLGKK